MTRELLILIDGHALAFRAFHALAEQNLRASDGEPTYAVFGFAQIMLTTIQERHPEYVAVSFDIGRTFRHDLYAEYKAGRAETPAEFRPQLARIKEMLGTLNIPIYTAEKFEADDVIGTLAAQATALGRDTLILTGDTDTLQLVDEHVHVLLANPYQRGSNTTEYGLDKVLERYGGLRPDQLADLRGLKGDASDNIPGVKGIGEKGAVALLNQFGSVENLFDRLAEVPKRYQKTLDGQRENAASSKNLATIRRDVPVQLDLAAARLRDYNRTAVVELFQQLEFGVTLIKKLPSTAAAFDVAELPPSVAALPSAATPQALELPRPPSAGPEQLTMFDMPVATGPVASLVPGLNAALPPPTGEYVAVVTEAALAEVVAALTIAPAFAFDTETDRLRAVEAIMVGVSLATRAGHAWYIPVGHTSGEQLPRAQVVAALRPFFENPGLPKYAHNAKFDIEVLRGAGIEVHGLAFDSYVVAALLNKQQHGLKALAFYEQLTPEPMSDIDELIGKGKAQISFADVPIERATPYAAADADMTLRLTEKLRPQLAQLSSVEQIFERLELPVLSVIVDMEWAGIKLDGDYIRALGGRLGARLRQLEDEIYGIAGAPFNINSGDQLSDVLFGKLQLPTEGIDRTAKTKKYSLTAEALDRLQPRDTSGIIERILQYRQLAKLKSTYVDSLPTLVNAKTGRVHTTYNQVGAATGRLSSNDPNLQNIPVRTQEGREIRRGFVAEQGHTFVAADYSQIELRVLAHISGDPGLNQAFVEDQDIHAATASALFNVPIDKVDKNQRRVAKCVAEGTLVTTDRGVIPIEQLGQASVDEIAPISCWVAQDSGDQKQATGFYNNGMQPTIRITTEHGYILEATGDHRVRSLDAKGDYIWVKLNELTHGSYVALARNSMMFGTDESFKICYTRARTSKLLLPEKLSPSFARFLGYYVAEGNCRYGRTSNTVCIHNTDLDVLADLRRISEEVFGAPPHESVASTGVTTLIWHSSRLVELLEQLHTGIGAANKRIPNAVMQGSYASVIEFLRAFFEGDGSISGSFISAASKSFALVQQLQTLLLNLGIVCHLEQRDVPDHGRHYKLRLIGRDSRRLFAQHIGFISQRKRTRLDALMERQKTFEVITLPLQRERLLRLYPQTKRDLKEIIHACVRTKSRTVALTYQRLATILEQFPASDNQDIRILEEHSSRNLFYDQVKQIEYSERQVYDLIVPTTHTYVANGFVSHNTTVFGIVYGISAFGLAPRIGTTRSEAQGLIDALFERYPGLRTYIDDTLASARRDGYVQSLFGRRRYFPELRSEGGGGRNPRQQAAEREAINAPIQATSADIMKLAMINVARELRASGLKTKLLLQVHDELILEAPDDEVSAVADLVRTTMEQAYTLSVPLKVSVETGRNWEEMEEVA